MPGCSWSPWIFNGTKHKINHVKCLWGIRNTQVFVGVRRHWSDMPVLQCYCVFMDYLPSCLPHLVSKQRRAGLPALGAGSLWRGLLSALPGGTSGSAPEGSEVTGPYISSTTGQMRWGLHSPGTGAPDEWSCPHATTHASTSRLSCVQEHANHTRTWRENPDINTKKGRNIIIKDVQAASHHFPSVGAGKDDVIGVFKMFPRVIGRLPEG